MEIEIVETPIRFCLHGKSAIVGDNSYADVGLKLMNEMWKVVKESHTANSGTNHWVYLPDDRMFVGVKISQNAAAPNELEQLQFELQRYLKHLHIRPYQALPEKWRMLQAELVARGERIDLPSLEVYGHHCDDTSDPETTILIALKQKQA